MGNEGYTYPPPRPAQGRVRPRARPWADRRLRRGYRASSETWPGVRSRLGSLSPSPCQLWFPDTPRAETPVSSDRGHGGRVPGCEAGVPPSPEAKSPAGVVLGNPDAWENQGLEAKELLRAQSNGRALIWLPRLSVLSCTVFHLLVPSAPRWPGFLWGGNQD